MSELALTLFRLGFLILLWLAVFWTLAVLRRDLRAPREARPVTVSPSAPLPPRTEQPRRSRKSKGRKIVITDGALVGKSIALETASITIGRAPDSTLVLDDDYVSTRHARIYPNGADWVVEDLGSTNGTWVNRTRIVSPTIIPVGATVKIGRTTMEIRN